MWHRVTWTLEAASRRQAPRDEGADDGENKAFLTTVGLIGSVALP